MGWKKRRDFSEGQGIFNGDVGFIEKIDKEFNQMTVIFDEDKYVTYDFSQLDELELAYAVTVHKKPRKRISYRSDAHILVPAGTGYSEFAVYGCYERKADRRSCRFRRSHECHD